MKQTYETGYFTIKSDNYGNKEKREAILNRNKDFKDHINNIFENHLIAEYWEDEDPEGKSAGVYINMEYEGEEVINNLAENITIHEGRIEVELIDEDFGKFDDVILTDEQLIVVGILIQGFEEQAFEDQYDVKEFCKRRISL